MKSSSLATSSFVLATLVMTWPLAAGVGSDVPGDLGDALLNMWILGWGAEHLPRVVAGDMPLGEFWNANIFHPEPLALAFSEHLFGQVLQALAVYHVTGNVILAYNLVYLSTFVLSGLAMFLLVRALLGETGFSWAALLAGLLYAFVPMRIAQVAHIQSVSSQWMPLALYGFHRFLVGRARPGEQGAVFARLDYRALGLGTLAMLMQNWSNGYYLMYFAPFALLFALHQIAALRRARDPRVWLAFAAAAAVVVAGTLPFLFLYVEGQRVHGIERPLAEVIRFSADVYSYLTAPEALRVWGSTVQAYPKPEGELFFGLMAMLLAACAVAAMLTPQDRRHRRSGEAPEISRDTASRTARIVSSVLAVMILVQLCGLIGILLTGGFITSVAGVPIRATNPVRGITGIAIWAGLLLAISPRARRRLLEVTATPTAAAIVLALLAMWLSLGPLPRTQGQVLPGLGLYGVLYDQVPGFDGLRVPARYAMVAAVFVSIAAGFGAAWVLRCATRPALVGLVMAALLLVDLSFAPMPLNQTWGDSGVTPPPRVEPASRAPLVYRALASMDDARVVAEFPFGDPAWELRSVYYSTVHWKRLVNGYSGAFPRGYMVRSARLQRVSADPDAAWQTLLSAGTTHVVVRGAAYPPGEAEAVASWLTTRGAVLVGQFDADALYEVVVVPLYSPDAR